MSTVEQADDLSKRRARMLPVVAILILQQLAFFSDADGTVSIVLTAAWIALALVATALLLTGGYWFRAKELRALVNDEISEANRAKGLSAAFAGAMLTAILVFAVSPFEPIAAQEAAHLIVSVSLAMGLLVFAMAENKSLG